MPSGSPWRFANANSSSGLRRRRFGKPRSGQPTAIVTFVDEGHGTRYTARALHWTVEDRKAHEEMGFHAGWGQCADQLAALAAKL